MTHSSAITRSARGMHCTVRLAMPCASPETVVYAHLYMTGRRAASQPKEDLHGCYACKACHDIIDRRGDEWLALDPLLIAERTLDGMMETQKILLERGLFRLSTKEAEG